MTSARLPWPALLLISALLLMPFGRMVEIPMGLLALAGLVGVFRDREFRQSGAWMPLAALFAAFALPMLLALPDALAPQQSLRSTLGTLRYALFCAALLCWFRASSTGLDSREQLLHAVGASAAVLLTLWCLDGLLQAVTGTNVLGYGLGEGYVNGVFGDDDNIKFGFTVAFLLPLALVHGLRNWPPLAVLAFLLLVLTLIVLSGKRAAWLYALVELGAAGIYYFCRGRLQLSWLVGLVAVFGLAVFLAFNGSQWVRDRSVVLVEAFDERDYATVNRATGKRLPIWRTALRIGEEHWINGVGPRGFRYAYPGYAQAGDEWAEPAGAAGGSLASHPHQLLLELLTETGVIGLLGYGLFVVLLCRLWLRASQEARSRALPYALTLTAMLFPFNTHPGWYSSWHALFLWFMVGLYLLAIDEGSREVPPHDC